MKLARLAILTTSLSLLAVAGRGGTPAQAQVKLLNVSYDPTRELYQEVNKTFAEKWKQQTGQTVEISQSHGGSGKQARSVIDGLEADVVTLALAADIDAIVEKSKRIAPDWATRLPNRSTPYSSTIVFVVRKGNPRQIKDWEDLVKPGTVVVTANPKTSGGARWAYLAAWGAAQQKLGSPDKAKDFVAKLYKNAVSLPSSGRDATTAFLGGTGDVFLTYENEAILAKQNGADVDYVLPADTLLIENPAAVTVDASDAAKSFLEFMTSPEAQADYAQSGFRPVVDGVEIGEVEGANDPSDPFPAPEQLFTIDGDFNGWGEAADKYFGDGEDGNPLGIITELQQETGKVGDE